MIEYGFYKEQLENYFYNLVLEKNIDYFKKHGVGPYEYNGRFANRVQPYLDAGYWQEYHKWLEGETGAVCNNNILAFKSEREETLFILRWSQCKNG